MPRPEDQRYRQMIVENLDHAMLVEAGAGSGKTTSLVQRMLALIATGRCGVDTMAAVTFTRKAAAELKGRFQIELERSFAGEEDKEKQRRFQAALSNLELLFAGTIHSFCARVLRERPIEARLDPDFEELDEIESMMLRDRCWSEYLEDLQAKGSPLLEKVIDLGLDPAELIDTYKKVALYPEVAVVGKEAAPPDFGKEKKLLGKYLDRAWKALPKKVPDDGWDSLQGIIRQACLRRRYLDLNNDLDFVKVLTGLDRSGGIIQKRWHSPDVAKGEKAAFDTFKAGVVSPCLDKWRRYCHYFIMELVVPAVSFYRDVRETNALMDYQDLLLKSAALLKNNSEVRAYFQHRFTHILVDEFQDTDPIQAEVILYLTGEDLAEKIWQKTRIKPGALFIVGDPKQSIYRFRRADIDIYVEMKRIIKDSGGLVVPLTTNFRSTPAVCIWINPVFEAKFPKQATTYQPGYEPLIPFKRMKDPGVKRISIPDVPYNNQKTIAWQDAERVATWINWALAGNFEVIRSPEEKNEGLTERAGPGDFMILLRYKAHLSLYARALEDRQIPYEISGGGAFNESEEIKHLLNLLAAVAEPEDQVSLAATLRGPLFGVSDDLLYRFRSSGGRFSYFSALDKCSDEEAGASIGGIFKQIQTYHLWARTQPPAAALSMIMDRLGIVPLAMTGSMGGSRAGNLLKALELGFNGGSNTLMSFSDMVERLRQLYQEVDVEEMSIEPGKTDAVRIMNLHKAKGLEATVVFLADPLKEISHPPDLHISRSEKRTDGYFRASLQTGGYKRDVVGIPPDWERVEALEAEYQRAEEDRLLYVAATRARQLLVVSRYLKKAAKGAWKDFYPYLDSVAELETEAVPTPHVTEVDIEPKDVEAGKKGIAKKIATSKTVSYITESITAAAKASAKETPFSADTGQGMSWGRMFHKLIEAAAKDDAIDLGLMAENLLKAEERPASEKNVIVKTVKSVMSSALWTRMKRSDNFLVEVPFSLKVDQHGTVKIVSGIIDLVFKEPEGWVIADYKTDKIDGNLKKLVDYYKPQVELYSKFWGEMTGEKIKESGLYFVDTNEWVKILAP